MKYLRNKKAQWILCIAVIIIVPILYHQVMGIITGIMMKKAMGMPANVQTMQPVEKEICSSTESAGRIEAKYSVDVVARINGWLKKRYFEEGAKVEDGQTLFLIEPDEYQIAVNNAAAAVRQTQAALINAEKELVRAQELVKRDYVSKSYYDQALATRDQARAALDSAKAQLANANLNLSYTKVTSPIKGKIGKIMITEGNLVNPQSGPLARIVSTSPIYAYFTLKSSDYLKLKKADSSADFSNMSVKIQLADGSIYDEEGVIEFVDNRIDPTAGTISLRATFQNNDELLVPGDFVKVIVTSKTPVKYMLVPQSCVLDEANGYYVWIINKDNQAEKRTIKVSDEIDKNWIVTDGLEYTDTFVVKGVQSIRMPGQKVNPTPLEDETKQNVQPAEQKKPSLFEKIKIKISKK